MAQAQANTTAAFRNNSLNSFTRNLPCQLFLGEVLSWESTTSLIKMSKIFSICVNLITAPFTVIFNMFVFLAVSRNQSFRKERLVVLACLAFTDFISGFLCQPLYIAKEVYFLNNTRPNCALEKAFYLSAYVTLSVSFPQLVIVTYERYVAITAPYEYPRRITNRRLICATVYVWVHVSVETILYYNYPFSENELKYVNFFGLFLTVLMFLFIVNCYIRIAIVVRRHRLNIESQQQSVTLNSIANDQRVKFQKKSSLSAVILMSILIPAYVPLQICYGLLNAHGDKIRKPGLYLFLPIAETFTLLNSFTNPIIYCLRTDEFKGKLVKYLGLKGNDIQPHSSVPMELSINPC